MPLSVGDWQQQTTTSVTTRLTIDRDNNAYFGWRRPIFVREPGPQHDGSSFGVVWVNDIGREAMASEKAAKFPVGSVIVREKFAKRDDDQPQLLAVMIKRTNLFSPKSGDWEYFITDGGLTKVRDQQRIGNCSACHAQQQARDFVFRVTETK